MQLWVDFVAGIFRLWFLLRFSTFQPKKSLKSNPAKTFFDQVLPKSKKALKGSSTWCHGKNRLFQPPPLCYVFPFQTSKKFNNTPRIVDTPLPLKPWHHLWMTPKHHKVNLNFEFKNFQYHFFEIPTHSLIYFKCSVGKYYINFWLQFVK